MTPFLDSFLPWLFILVLGLVFGSFLNVLIIRLKQGSSILGRSHCMSCKKTIKARHLIPVFSWLWLRGRCAYCRKPIHAQYPLVEAAAAAFALIAYLRHPFFFLPQEILPFLFELFFTLDLLMLGAGDWRFTTLPVEWMAGSILVFGAWGIWSGVVSLPSAMIGLLVGTLFLGVQALVSRGKWMGWGDPWLGALIGVVLGWPGIGVSLYLTYLVGGILAAFLLISHRAKRGARLPFGPLLIIGALLTLWFGSTINRLFGG